MIDSAAVRHLTLAADTISRHATPQPDAIAAVMSWVGLTAGVMTILQSGVVLYLFIWKRRTIAAVLRLLLNASLQSSLTEIHSKLDELSTLHITSTSERDRALGALAELQGQIRGCAILRKRCSVVLRKIAHIIEAGSDQEKELRKRSLVSEVRGIIKEVALDATDVNLGGLLDG